MSLTTTNNPLVPTSMEAAIKMADLMARTRMLPAHLQSSPGDCLMVIEQAVRWGMSPFAVAQCTSVIQGKLMFEGKLVAAALHTSGALATRLSYDYTGEGNSRVVRVSATLAGETVPRWVDVKLADAKTTNKMWTTQPDQQLAYHGARVWARRYAPEVMLGVNAPEEMEPAPSPHSGTTIDARAEPAPEVIAPPVRTLGQFLDELETNLRAAPNYAAVMALVEHPDTRRAQDKATNGAAQRLADMIEAATARVTAADGDDFPGVVTEAGQ
jgi:hypothetical protein